MTRTAMLWLMAAILIGGFGCSKGAKQSSDKREPGKSAPAPVNAAAAAKSAALAGAAFEKVQTGMTPEEVTKIMGTPTHQVATGEVVQYHWQKGQDNYVVHFQDGKVAQKYFGSGTSGGSTGAAKKEDFSKVRVGMTREEVIKILGRPTEGEGLTGGEGGVSGAAAWRDGDTELAVVFQNGKVMSASINRDSKDSGE